MGMKSPGRDLVFEAEQESQIRFGVEICEDLWHVNAPSDDLYANGKPSRYLTASAPIFLLEGPSVEGF